MNFGFNLRYTTSRTSQELRIIYIYNVFLCFLFNIGLTHITFFSFTYYCNHSNFYRDQGTLVATGEHPSGTRLC